MDTSRRSAEGTQGTATPLFGLLGGDGSARHDCRRQCRPMVLRPRRAERCSRAAKHFASPVTEDAHGIVLDSLGVVGMDQPAPLICDFGQHFAIHDGVGSTLVWHLTLKTNVLGEVQGPDPNRDHFDRLRQRNFKFIKGGRCPPDDRRTHVCHQRSQRFVVERVPGPVKQVRASLVVDGCRRNTGLDQLNPSAVDDPVIGRGRDGHRPAVVMCDAKTHAIDSAIGQDSRDLGGEFVDITSRRIGVVRITGAVIATGGSTAVDDA
jgi:hypothetical protein